MTKVDARGLSCPEPVILTQNALKSGEASYEVLVDAVAPRENVTRCAMHNGYDVTCTEEDGVYTLTLTKKA